MGLSNCPECGKIYVENPMKLCPECQREELEAEDRVAQYLRDIKGSADIKEISKATGVKEKIVLRMLSRGRIISDCDITYPCEVCGAPIVEGRVCDKCSTNIVDKLQEMTKGRAEEVHDDRKVSRMYTNVNKIKRK